MLQSCFARNRKECNDSMKWLEFVCNFFFVHWKVPKFCQCESLRLCLQKKGARNFEVEPHLSYRFLYHVECYISIYLAGSFQCSWVILSLPSIFCVTVKKFDPADSWWKNAACQFGVLSSATACLTAYWTIFWASSKCKLHNRRVLYIYLLFCMIHTCCCITTRTWLLLLAFLLSCYFSVFYYFQCITKRLNQGCN